jgi:hypothetical protein
VEVQRGYRNCKSSRLFCRTLCRRTYQASRVRLRYRDGAHSRGARKGLAHLQLGRALAGQGDTSKARVAYQDFLMLWRDADPDIPILKQAKLEYARLQ